MVIIPLHLKRCAPFLSFLNVRVDDSRTIAMLRPGLSNNLCFRLKNTIVNQVFFITFIHQTEVEIKFIGSHIYIQHKP